MMNRTSNIESRRVRWDGTAWVVEPFGTRMIRQFRIVGDDEPGIVIGEPTGKAMANSGLIRIETPPRLYPVEISVHLLTASQWARLPELDDPGGYYFDRTTGMYYRITERPTG